MLREVIQIFLDDLLRQIEAVRKAIGDRNSKKLQTTAHTLKGSMLILRTKSPYQNASKLEQMGIQNKLDESEVIFEILRRDLTALADELGRFLEGDGEQPLSGSCVSAS